MGHPLKCFDRKENAVTYPPSRTYTIFSCYHTVLWIILQRRVVWQWFYKLFYIYLPCWKYSANKYFLEKIIYLITGCLNLDSGVGLYACDPQAYHTFATLFDDVIKDYHNVDEVSHPTPSWNGKGFETDEQIKRHLNQLEETGKGMIVSTRVRVGRSHAGVPFPPTLTNEVCFCQMFLSTRALFLPKWTHTYTFQKTITKVYN